MRNEDENIDDFNVGMELTPTIIKKWRVMNGITQRELAMILGADASTISRWELGKSEIKSTGILETILKTLILQNKKILKWRCMKELINFGSWRSSYDS